MNHPATTSVIEPLRTKLVSRAQLLLCRGCCCGRTDRGLPEVPVERMKTVWKAEKLNRAVQLTISGCLGPCELPNVAVLVAGDGMQWLGCLEGDADYDALLGWARQCRDTGLVPPCPDRLVDRKFERFRETSDEPQV